MHPSQIGTDPLNTPALLWHPLCKEAVIGQNVYLKFFSFTTEPGNNLFALLYLNFT